MKGKRYTTEDKIRILREVDGGKTVLDICRERNIAEQTFYRWRSKYGALKEDEAIRLKTLEQENARLKRLVADQALDIRALKELAEGKW